MLTLWREKFGDEATYLKLATGFEEAKMGDMLISLLDWLQEHEQSSRGTQRMVAKVPRLGACHLEGPTMVKEFLSLWYQVVCA